MRTLLLSAAAFFFMQFIFFSYLVHEDLFTQLDFDATVKLQDNIAPRWDNEFSFLSAIGKFEVTTLVLLGIFLVIRRWAAGAVAFSAYVLFHLIEIFGKWFVNHPPPPQFMLRTEQILNLPQFHVRSEFSYPSGHSGRTIFLSILFLILIWQSRRLSLFMKFILTGGIVGFAIAMLVSRVSLGEHWATDVIGGTLLGAAMGLFAGAFLIEETKGTKKKESSSKKRLFPKFKFEIKKVE